MSDDTLAKWDKLADGRVMLCPLGGFQIEANAGMHVIARLEFWRQGDPFDREPSGSVQLVLPPHIAGELAAMLQSEADKCVATRPPGRPN